jgi:hypothetical protein
MYPEFVEDFITYIYKKHSKADVAPLYRKKIEILSVYAENP